MMRIKTTVMRWFDRLFDRSNSDYRDIKHERVASIQRQRRRDSVVVQRVLGQQEGRPR